MYSRESPPNNPINNSLSAPLAKSRKRSLIIRANQIRHKSATNAPYISSDSIAAQVDYLLFGISGRQKLNIKKLMNANSIYVKSDQLEQLFELAQRFELRARVLVTGNSDRNFCSLIGLPSNFQVWYCQNNAVHGDLKIRTLPLGIENIRLGRLGFPKYFSAHSPKADPTRICVPPMSPTNPIRYEAVEFARKFPQLFHVYSNYLIEKEYFRLTQSYRFILCCEGNGFENHRIWETLYQGSFPILVRSPWSVSLEYLELPILFVNSLNDLNVDMLKEHAEAHKSFVPGDLPQLWTPYWRQKFQY